MEPIKGTFTTTLTGYCAGPKSEWYWRLGRRFAKWLALFCGEYQYVVTKTPMTVNYSIGEDGKTVEVSFVGTSEAQEMTMTDIPEHIQPK